MIATISGKVTEVSARAVTVETAGVGYEVYVSSQELAALKNGAHITLYVHDHVRENSHELYGFNKIGDRELFRQLISVSGVGPRLAMAILSGAGPDAVRAAVASGESLVLQSVPGVGTRTAARITIELKNKIVSDSKLVTDGNAVYEAMRRLGYTAAQAREAIQAIPADITDETERIKTALKGMSQK